MQTQLGELTSVELQKVWHCCRRTWWAINELLHEDMMSHQWAVTWGHDEPSMSCYRRTWWAINELLQEDMMSHQWAVTWGHDQPSMSCYMRTWSAINELLHEDMISHQWAVTGWHDQPSMSCYLRTLSAINELLHETLQMCMRNMTTCLTPCHLLYVSCFVNLLIIIMCGEITSI